MATSNAGAGGARGLVGAAGVGEDADGVAASGDGGPAPLAPEVLVGLADFGASYVSGPANSTQIAVTDEPFQQAWQASMTQSPATPWDAQLIVPLNLPVSASDLLSVSFWVRCATGGANGDCETDFIFERASDPWEKSVVVHATAGSAWMQNSEFFRPAMSYGAGEAHMLFRLGYATQVIEIGGLLVERIPAE
jgi:hypothetical protein